jgi:hypothetical protein
MGRGTMPKLCGLALERAERLQPLGVLPVACAHKWHILCRARTERERYSPSVRSIPETLGECMNLQLISIVAAGVLSLSFIDNLSLSDFGWDAVSGAFAGGVGTAEGASRAQACTAAQDDALKHIASEHASRVTDKSCSCTVRSASIETWRSTASVRWKAD